MTNINKRTLAFKCLTIAVKAYMKKTGCGLKDAYTAITHPSSI